jgi:glycosyltransferase involved in cell wall biosynthesis
MHLPAFSIVIPAFNEEASIGSVLARVATYVEGLRSRFEVEIVAVDDGSSDGTLAVLTGFSVDNPGVLTVAFHRENAGLTAAMRTGAETARFETVVFLDADLSYRPEIVEPLVTARQRAGAVAALASPYMRGGRVANVPPVRLIASRGANWILSRCAGGRLHTFTGMVRAYDRAEFLSLFDRAIEGEFNAWAAAELLRRGHRVVEIPAVLAWPPERYAAPSRLTLGKLRQRAALVVRTARVLREAVRASEAKRRAGTLVLGCQPTRPYSSDG